ncbi:hypothetical protein B0H13DRAFT_1867908 [Mycena leptocephala]|nr:hypothetical protein B0H13DRAFT_1867908 [Mycena leptocephala]
MIALSHTSHLFRTLVKALFRIRLIHLVELFVGAENTEEFFRVLQLTGSAIGGSTLPLALVPPVDDEIDDWTPNNLNIYFGLYNLLTCLCNQRKPIMVSESIDTCVITPAIAATATLGMCIATCSSMYILYPELLNKRRALEGWFEPSIPSCVSLQMRGYRRSLSNMGWSKSCGWNCPAVWRRIQGLCGVGTFCWGGYDMSFEDNTSIEVPFTDVALKWRLGDNCSNVHCPWSSEYIHRKLPANTTPTNSIILLVSARRLNFTWGAVQKFAELIWIDDGHDRRSGLLLFQLLAKFY